MFFLFSSLMANAQPEMVNTQPELPERFLPSKASYQSWKTISPHGPDGPPPDGGYTITDDDGSNFFGKVGLLCLGGSIVSGVLFLTAQAESPEKDQYKNIALGSAGAGVGFIVLERIF